MNVKFARKTQVWHHNVSCSVERLLGGGGGGGDE